ncbi:carboxypeptidase-like regulatory domain-containing protein [Candidatus Neomarinimicrobiota bacterium]
MSNIHISKITCSLLLWVIMISPAISEGDFGIALIDEYDWHTIPASLTDSISIDLNRVTYGEALGIIADRGNFKLNYNRNRIPVDQIVTLDMENIPVFEILFVLLQRTRTTLIVTPDEELAVVPARRDHNASISGQVLDQETKAPLTGTNISILGTHIGCVSDSTGHFTVLRAPEGFQILQLEYIGYETRKVVTYLSNSNTTPDLTVELKPRQILLQEITVTPGLFSIMGKGPTMQQTLTHEDMQNITFGDDVYRALTRLPGVGANDFSAKFTVRGGENEEILVLLDGVEIYEPFHLKDVAGGAFSFIDVGVIEGVDLLTGGFPAEYGNRMSGVLTMKTIRPSQGSSQTSLGLSMTNTFYRSEGTFDGGTQGAWFLSMRRGFLDILLDIVGADEEDVPRPVYYDIHGKLDYQLDRKHQLSVHFLHAGDQTEYVEYNDFLNYREKVGETKFGNTYGWINYRSNPLPRLFSQAVVSVGNLSRRRESEETNYDQTETFSMVDRRDATVFGLRQNWNVQFSDRWHIKAGMSIQHHESDYRYDLHTVDEDRINSDSVVTYERTAHSILNPKGNSYSAHMSNRLKFLDPLVLEIGLRFDAIGYSNTNKLSPRLNLVWTLAEQTFFRAGWGYFYQNDGIHEIRVEDGEDNFLPPEMAEHWVAGFEQIQNNGMSFRVETYYKKMTHLQPKYRNGSNHIQFPELEGDRYQLNLNGASFKGIEFYWKYDRGGKVSWWASYARVYFDDNINNLVFRDSMYTQGFTIHPNIYDQRHTFYLDLNFRPNPDWQVNLAYQSHSGLPYIDLEEFLETPPEGGIRLGQDFSVYNRDNYDPYSRVDLRINRNIQLRSSQITLYLQVINLLDFKNLRTIKYDDYMDQSGQAVIYTENEYWFPRLPSLGITWEWNR